MNKKVALSLLSATVFASMTASAFAAPKSGVYMGGDVDRYYALTDLFKLNDAGYAKFQSDLAKTKFENLIFVDHDGKGASLKEILSSTQDFEKIKRDLKQTDFEGEYAKSNLDGTNGESYDPRKDITPEPTGDLKVESVSAINLNQFAVKFTKNVDETSAETITNYKLNNIGLTTGTASASLQADGKTVVVTLVTPRAQSEEATVTVSGVQEDETFNLVPTATKTVTFADTTAPTVSSVTMKGNTKLVVKFSEAVKDTTANNYLTINGLPLSAFNASASAIASTGVYGETVTITFNSPLNAGSYKLNIGAGLFDAAGFPVAKQDKDFSVVADTTAPTVVSTTATTSGLVKVVFNKPIDSTSLTGAFSINGGAPVNGTLKADGVTVEVQFGPTEIKAGANVLVINKKVADAYGNKVSTTTDLRVAVNAASDTTPPAVNTVAVKDDRHFTVVFSKPVNSVYANNPANYNLYNAAGSKVSSTYFNGATFVTRTAAGQTNMVDITLAAGKELPGGTYRLDIANIQDMSGNTMAPFSTNIVSPDKTAPDFATGTQGVAYATGNKVEVYYSEPMAVSGAGSILNPANYSYSTDGGVTWNAIPSNATLTPGVDNKSVIFTFGTDVIATSINKVRAANVTDVAGNVIKNIAPTATIVAANVATPVSILNTSSSYPALTVNGSVASVTFKTDRPLVSVLPGDFSVAGQTPDTASLNGTTVTLNFTAPVKVTALKAAGSNIALATVANPAGEKDGAGIGLKPYIGANAIDVDDEVAPEIVDNGVAQVNGSTTKVQVTFNEAIDASIVGLYKDDFIVTVNGAPVTITSAAVVTGNILELTASKSLVGTVAIVPNEPKIDVQDENGNKYVPTSKDLRGYTFSVDVPVPVVATGIAAQFDGLAMTTLSATVDTTVTKVEAYKGTNLVVSKNLSNETSYTDTVVGLAVGDTVTLKFYVGTDVVQTTNVTVVVPN